MADKRGKEITSKKGCDSPGSAAAGAVNAKHTLHQAGEHQLGKGNGKQPVENSQNTCNSNQRPASIKEGGFFFFSLSHKSILTVCLKNFCYVCSIISFFPFVKRWELWYNIGRYCTRRSAYECLGYSRRKVQKENMEERCFAWQEQLED